VLDVTFAGWAVTIGVIVALFVLDLFVSRPGGPSSSSSSLWLLLASLARMRSSACSRCHSALLQLGVWPARLDRPQHSAVGVTDDPPWLAGQRAEEGAPVGRVGAREGLGAPEPRLAARSAAPGAHHRDG
jgi:hypothetical protein